MVCARIVRRAPVLWVCFAVLAISPLGATGQPSSQAPAGDAVSAALDTVLARAATMSAGTYVVSNGTIEPSQGAVPVVVQPDFLRGPEQSVRVPVSLRAMVPEAARVRIRVVAPGDGRVVGEVGGTAATGQVRFLDEFRLSPGQYELHAALGHAQSGGGSIVALSKSSVTVPDVWQGGLSVTPIVLGETAASAPAGPAGRPFTYGQTALTPAGSDRFARSANLNVAFRVYNWTAPQGEKPDLTVEYLFYDRATTRPVFYNKMKPQRLTSANLGDSFDASSGMVAPGMAVALQSFTFGQFQLTVRVTDNRTKQTATQQVNFVVSPDSGGPVPALPR